MLYLLYFTVSLCLCFILLYPNSFWILLLCLVFVAAILFAVSGTLTAQIMLSLKHVPRPITNLSPFTNFHKCILQCYNVHIHKVEERLPVVFGRTVDSALQEFLDLVVRDLISPWLEDLSLSSQDLQYSIKKEIWFALGKLNERLVKIDKTKLLAVDMVTKVTSHFERIRLIQAGTDGQGQFSISPHLMNPEKEINYLRKISELLLLTLFSKSLVSHPCNKSLLIEVLACQVLYPCINLITDSDYINQKILDYMEQILQTTNFHQSSCAQIESFQDFIQIIRKSDDVDHLKHVRYSIMTEIMQATTIRNLKMAKDVDKDKDKDQLSHKKLRKYLGQLKYAQLQCENRLRDLCCPGFPVELDHPYGHVPEKKVLPFERVLESQNGRKMLYQFLERDRQESFLEYWVAVEELRTTDKKNLHQVGAEIFYTFIHSPGAKIKVEKSVRRRLESFLLGNSGPEAFYEVQDNVVEFLKGVYLNFVWTEFYGQFLQQYESSNQELRDEKQSSLENEKIDSVVEQSCYAKNRLNQLQEKLNNKSQALQALRWSLKPESKVLSDLEKEVENLEGEKRQLEAHLTRTEIWEEHLGKWRAIVQSAEANDDKEPPQFILVVHVVEDDFNSDAVSTGWVVLRKLSEFHELHKKLLQVWNGVKQMELPSQSSKFFFGKQSDKNSLEKAKSQIQKYLEFILQDERLNTNEAVYTFLCPSSENLKISNSGIPSPKKNRFSLSSLFKTSNNQGNGDGSRDSDEEDFSLLDENDVKLIGNDGKDAIAEPLYALLGEVFDLRGVFRWLRKTLITFVQITYGRTISRQVVDTVGWLFSEQMVHYYIRTFIKSWWPNGTLVKQHQSRTTLEKQKTKIDAKSKFINNTPEVLNIFVGQQNARRGAIKVFQTLQEIRLNKQLFYDLLEILIYELFPEVKCKNMAGKKKTK